MLMAADAVADSAQSRRGKMENSDVIKLLEHKGVKATANRILVVKALATAKRPMSLSQMEDSLSEMDKSSIFRVLSLFQENDIVHTFEDGRGILNYELCAHDGLCNHTDSHIHFYCEACKQSFCLEDLPLPKLNLPEGFTQHSISFVIKGECPACHKRHG